MNRATFRYVESHLYAFHDLRRQMEERRSDLIESGTSLEQALLGSRIQANRYHDPTESKGMRLLTDPWLVYTLLRLDAIERVTSSLDAISIKVLTLTYWAERSRAHDIAKQCCISLRTYYRVRRYIVVRVAYEMGLIARAEMQKEACG